MTSDSTHRLFFLGAGFSQPAGLPLGAELFRLVRNRVSERYGSDNHVERDLRDFKLYLRRCYGRSIDSDEIDAEEFLGFLDVEHYLRLRGSDTWSEEGNEAQLMMRVAIAEVISQRTPRGAQIPDVYRRFVRGLTNTDLIRTFNYDTLLENVLESEGMPYRLFPLRYSQAHPSSSIVAPSSANELVLLKLHGSVDWFSRSHYDQLVANVESEPYLYPPNHEPEDPMFGKGAFIAALPITQGSRPEGEGLTKLYRVKELNAALSQPFWRCSPFILAPSSMKLFYAEPLLEFWRGLQNVGALHLSLCIIGYSLPRYDEYAMQAIYHVSRNYQYVEPHLRHRGRQKTKVRFVDFQPTRKGITSFRRRYRFLNWRRTEARFDGFNNESVDWLLR